MAADDVGIYLRSKGIPSGGETPGAGIFLQPNGEFDPQSFMNWFAGMTPLNQAAINAAIAQMQTTTPAGTPAGTPATDSGTTGETLVGGIPPGGIPGGGDTGGGTDTGGTLAGGPAASVPFDGSGALPAGPASTLAGGSVGAGGNTTPGVTPALPALGGLAPANAIAPSQTGTNPPAGQIPPGLTPTEWAQLQALQGGASVFGGGAAGIANPA